MCSSSSSCRLGSPCVGHTDCYREGGSHCSMLPSQQQPSQQQPSQHVATEHHRKAGRQTDRENDRQKVKDLYSSIAGRSFFKYSDSFAQQKVQGRESKTACSLWCLIACWPHGILKSKVDLCSTKTVSSNDFLDIANAVGSALCKPVHCSAMPGLQQRERTVLLAMLTRLQQDMPVKHGSAKPSC